MWSKQYYLIHIGLYFYIGFQLMEDSLTGQSGTRVLPRVVVEHRVEPGFVPIRYLNIVELTALEIHRRHKAVTKYPVQVIRLFNGFIWFEVYNMHI